MSDDHGHHGPRSFWTKYVFSTDHKVIGLQFTFSALLFVLLGGLLALGVRYQIAWPNQDVPYAEILPGKMTDKAPESNRAHWQIGGEVAFLMDQEIEGRKFPKGAKAVVKGFPDGLAVILPKGTIVEDADGETRTLVEGRPAVVDHRLVIGDYNYNRQPPPARAAVGTEVTLTGDKPEVVTLAGREVLAPSVSGAPNRSTDRSGALLLPQRLADIAVDLEVPEQTVEVKDASALAGFGLSDEQVKTLTGELEAIRKANAEVNAARDAELTPLREQREKLVTEHKLEDAEAASHHPEIAAIDSRIARITDNFKTQLKDEVVEAPVASATLTGVKTTGLMYEKEALTTDAYLQLFTMHASVMIFFVIIPMLVGGFGNFLIPLMIGARDMAFPKLNAFAFWITVPAGVLMLASFWVANGPAGGGWTMYPTLSEAGRGYMKPELGTTIWIMAVGLVGFSSVVGALNYITTIINMRAPGMHMFRMPLTVWSLFITSALALFATPVLTATMMMLLSDRLMGSTFFLPEGGGQVILFQHMFWFYSHPAVYIMILPAMGVTSDILSTFSRKPIFGYKPMVFAMAAITGLGFIVWGHHMFQSGMNPILGTTFMASTIMIALPSAIKTFNWLGTLWGGTVRFTPAMLFALGFVSMFVIGGLSGIFMASAPVDIQIHDTYFIVAHIHYVLFGGSMFGIFAGIYYWFPKMFGRDMNLRWGVLHFVMTLIAFNGTFFLMHILGVGGAPRRYASYMEYPTLEHLQGMNVVMTIFAMMLGTAQLPFMYNFFTSLPTKLGRAIVAVFVAALAGPTVAGLTFWEWYYDPTVQGGAGNLYGALGGAIGTAILFIVVAVLAVFLIWEVGRRIQITRILTPLLYIFTLPAFLAPMLLKQDLYLMAGMPGLFNYKMILLVLSAAPGLAYLALRRPRDEFGAVAELNPWQANSLEWATTSPPPHLNFDEIPTVYRGPYEFSSPVVREDYLPQEKKLPPGVVEPTGH